MKIAWKNIGHIITEVSYTFLVICPSKRNTFSSKISQLIFILFIIIYMYSVLVLYYII